MLGILVQHIHQHILQLFISLFSNYIVGERNRREGQEDRVKLSVRTEQNKIPCGETMCTEFGSSGILSRGIDRNYV